MTSSSHTFPFGRPVRPCKPSSTEPRPLFVLGAYPSALHVQWKPPESYSQIRAIAVDNEPEPFWNGVDEDVQVAKWKRAVRFDPATMGNVIPAGKLNGSSGEWVDTKVLAFLKPRAYAWITDCLDTYRCSKGLARRIEDTYNPFATSADIPQAVLLPHPSEGKVISEALRDHVSRLRREIETCRPDMIVTLGNAALAVVRHIYPRTGGADTRRLAATEEYGALVALQVGERRVDLLPLAHPAARAGYPAAHERWCASWRAPMV